MQRTEEGRALPCLKIETWGTQDGGEFTSQDLGHPPDVKLDVIQKRVFATVNALGPTRFL
jgi:hypothetical protein